MGSTPPGEARRWPPEPRSGWFSSPIDPPARFQVPIWLVKVDDTRAGMYEGRNAGAWTVGVHESGNDTYDQLREAEPDFLIPSIKDLPEVIFNQIDPRLARGELPGQGIR